MTDDKHAGEEIAYTTTWQVEILLGEVDGRTHGSARLRSPATRHLVGVGVAHLNPRDPDVPEIGFELATARALSRLGHQLLEVAADDIADVTHSRVNTIDLA